MELPDDRRRRRRRSKGEVDKGNNNKRLSAVTILGRTPNVTLQQPPLPLLLLVKWIGIAAS